MKILFLHGWTSIPGGRKPSYLNDHGHTVLNPALPDDDFAAAVRIAQAEYDQHQPDVVVGSSRGGAVAMNLDSRETPLVLLCPAWKRWGAVRTVKSNTTVLHSVSDEVVPFGDSEELVKSSGLPLKSLIEVGVEHRLADARSLAAMLEACEGAHSIAASILNMPAISGSYLFPQPRFVDDPFMAQVADAELACYRNVIDPDNFTMVHFHGNGEAIADYVPDMADLFSRLGLNSLFVEYREYGGSSGRAQLVAMLGDGEAVVRAAGFLPEKSIVYGRSIGSLYAIELAYRQPATAGLILESGIADPSERFLARVDLSAIGIGERDLVTETKRHFDHKRKLSGYKNPLLVMHAENDGLVDISHAERNYKWAGSHEKRLVRFPVGDHNTILGKNWNEYVGAVRGLVKAVQGRREERT